MEGNGQCQEIEIISIKVLSELLVALRNFAPFTKLLTKKSV